MSLEVDPEAYLTSFERQTTAAQWSQEWWSNQLGPNLIGEAQVAYHALTHENGMDYDLVKKAILQQLDITEETHRHRFQVDELVTIEQFVEVLGPEACKWVRRYRPTTLDAAVRLAEGYKDAMTSPLTRGRPHLGQSRGPLPAARLAAGQSSSMGALYTTICRTKVS
ncbi:hypothetical protein HHUSO_G2438 [Huso huso]|uniref:SCAN box domain-containing protein n=1 Tax=Huso huso TaxID=61971 RepID=A0ABR1A7C6_HUSHU